MVKSNLVNSNSSSFVGGTQTNTFSFYPNPTSETLNIISEENINEIIIYSITGQELIKTNNVNVVDVSSLAAGTYTITVKADNRVERQTIIVY